MAAKLVYKYAEVGGEAGTTYEFTEQRLQINLFYISQKFYDCLGRLKLSKNLTLFIDGIDIRPSQIPYEDYLDCIKGLANACWVLNTELFANVRDSKGHLKVVLLLRPDIFNSLSLQNATTKLDEMRFVKGIFTQVAVILLFVQLQQTARFLCGSCK